LHRNSLASRLPLSRTRQWNGAGMPSASPRTLSLAHCPGRCHSLSCRDRGRLASRTSLRRCGAIQGTPFNGQSGERSRYERVNLARRQVSGFRGSHRILSPRRGHGRNPSRPNPWSDEDISRGEGSRPLCRQLVSRRQSRPGNARGITRCETQPGANYESVVWSPDGRGIAFVQVVYVSGWHEVAVSLGIYDLVSGKSSSLFTTDRLRGALAWARDGRLIYSLSELPPNQNDSNLWTIKVDARGNQSWGQPVRLTSGPDGKMRASVSADGKRLLFLRWAESPVVYISEVQQAGRHFSPLRPLSLDERRN